jgi:two-component system, LytTR family, response regulator LytT
MAELDIIIIEDEQRAAADLAAQLTILDPEIEVIATLDSVAGSVNWFKNNPMPDLVFMDIHLGDGNCFEIFKQVQISCPIIFCTAYDEYALEAFKLNSIGYIVKPIDRERLAEALQKYHVLQQHYVPSSLTTDTISRIVQQQPRYKTSFLIPFKNKMLPLPVNAIACIYVKQERSYMVTADDELLVNKTLDQLQMELDPSLFYRVNRQYIVSFRYIKEIEQLSGRKIGIVLSIPYEEQIVVSKDAASGFKAWMEDR